MDPRLPISAPQRDFTVIFLSAIGITCKNVTHERMVETFSRSSLAPALIGSPTREASMHEALFPTHDEISRQVETAKRLRSEFLHGLGRSIKNNARARNWPALAGGGKNMRARHAFAIVATILVGFGLKFYFFSPPVAEAEVIGMDIASMHAAASPDMPRQELNDMTFVYSEAE